MPELMLSDLWEGKILALSKAIGLHMAEACYVCLNNQNHKENVELEANYEDKIAKKHKFIVRNQRHLTEKKTWLE